MNNEQKLKAASDEITRTMEQSAFYDIDEGDELIQSTAKKYGVSAESLSEYHNDYGYTAESLRQQVADDMGVPYDAVWHD